MAFCSGCGAQIADGTTMCAACSSRAAAPSAGAAQGTTGGMTDNVVGMLAYITIVPAIIFLVMEPYNKSRFVRFHCFQMIFFCVAMIAIWIGLTIIGFVPGLIFITFPLHMLVWLGSFIIWIILLIKANQGQMFKLPIIGDLAEKQANAM
jgi:uncharacterized membrane protein